MLFRSYLALHLLPSALICIIAVIDFASIGAEARKKPRRPRAPLIRSEKPNVILLITDDQDVMLGGAEFSNGFVTTPICCPSRSSILTGMLVHNHYVTSNRKNCSGPEWQKNFEGKTMATYMSKAGYKTGYFGKYLNGYRGLHIPPGWHEWMGLVRNSRYYNYTVNYNGRLIEHGNSYSRDYLTNRVLNDSLAFLKRSKRTNPKRPIFAVLSFPAPHGPEDPAPMYSHWFYNETSHRTPSWNYAPNPDKQWLLKQTGKMEPVHVAFTDFLHRRRLQTLMSVDEAVQKLYQELRDLGELRNTYVIYTSDHGYHLGQYGLVKGKNMPYEFDLKVPFLMRGPGIPKYTKIWRAVSNIDIAPTILGIAGLATPEHMDGESVLPLLLFEKQVAMGYADVTPPLWRDSLLIERERGHHLEKLDKIRKRFEKQRKQYTKDMRIQSECEKLEYKPPCNAFQQWECRRDSTGQYRIFKCRKDVVVRKNCVCYVDSEADSVQSTADEPPRPRQKRQVSTEESFNPSTSVGDDYYSFEDEAPISKEEREAAALVAEAQMEVWEEEFYQEALQRDVLESGWHQGVFDFAANLADDYHIPVDQTELDYYDTEDETENRRYRRGVELDAQESGAESVQTYRMQKLMKLLKQMRSQEPDEVLSFRGCRLYGNSTVSCRPGIYANRYRWRERKDSLDRRIKKFRKHLKNLKDIRKHLNRKSPLDPSDSTDSPSSEHCVCGPQLRSHLEKTANTSRTHPLRGGRKKDLPPILGDFPPPMDRPRRLFRFRGRSSPKGPRRQRPLKKLYCSVPSMHCFTHGNDHWQTPPRWILGQFCFCQNAKNNSYWCLRTVNETHNFLYCEFVTGFISYYDLNLDPHQLQNAVYKLDDDILEQLSNQLAILRDCQGAKQCNQFRSHLGKRSVGSDADAGGSVDENGDEDIETH